MHPSRRRPTPQLKGCDRAMELGRMDSILAEAELRCPEVQEVTPLHLLFITRKQDETLFLPHINAQVFPTAGRKWPAFRGVVIVFPVLFKTLRITKTQAALLLHLGFTHRLCAAACGCTSGCQNSGQHSELHNVALKTRHLRL